MSGSKERTSPKNLASLPLREKAALLVGLISVPGPSPASPRVNSRRKGSPHSPRKVFQNGSWAACCISTESGMVDMCHAEHRDTTVSLLARAVLHYAEGQHGGFRPGRIVTDEPGVAAALGAALVPATIVVEEVESINELDDFREHMRDRFADGGKLPNPLSVKGVTVEHMHALADAAREFHEAAPWRHLMNADLIESIGEVPTPDMRCVVVFGAGGIEHGLGFFRSPEDFAQREAGLLRVDGYTWSLTSVGLGDLGSDEAEIWIEGELPRVGELGCMLFAGYGARSVRRPTPAEWRYGEALLRAIARTTERELDEGRWSKRVPTIDGDMTLELTLPGLLRPPDPVKRDPLASMERAQVDMHRAMRGRDFKNEKEVNDFLEKEFAGREPVRRPPSNPADQAQDLLFEAHEAAGRRQLHLIRRALELDPLSADAYVMLAHRAPEDESRLEYFRTAIENGKRSLGSERFEEDVGHFWGLLETRPFMRALLGYAQTLRALGRTDEAIEAMRELLRLNANDNQGVRYELVPMLIAEDDSKGAREVLASCESEATPEFEYMRALLLYADGGDSPEARSMLRSAVKSDPVHGAVIAAPFDPLLHSSLTRVFGNRAIGDGELMLAISTGSPARDAWLSIEGAMEWLVVGVMAEMPLSRSGRGPAVAPVAKKAKFKSRPRPRR